LTGRPPEYIHAPSGNIKTRAGGAYHFESAAGKAKHERDGILDEALENWRWALEEYRVSVFAQGMKTAYPVSVQRLQKLWQNVAA